MLFDRVVLSSNLDPLYFEFIPFITRTYKKLFGVKITIAILNNDNINIPTINHQCKEADQVVIYKSIPGIPDCNLSKIVRLFTATLYDKEVIMINDMDLLPLVKKHIEYLMSVRGKNKVLCVGRNVYKGTKDEGKFPMGYLTAEGYLFKNLINPEGKDFVELAKSWIGTKVFDSQEDISSIVNHETAMCFSDESLLRVLISRWKDQEKYILHTARTFTVGIGSIDRENWKYDPEKLKHDGYVESHMLRPYSKYRDELNKLFLHLGVLS